MNPDLEYSKSRAVGLMADPAHKFQQLEAERGVALLREELHMEEATAQYEQKQQAQISGLNEAGAGIKQVLSEASQQMRDQTVQEQFNAALQDEEGKARFGTSPPKGIPGAIVAARQLYSDALHAKSVVGQFREDVEPYNQDVLDLMAQARRNDLAETYKANLGMTDDEAERRISELYGPMEVGLGLVDAKPSPSKVMNFFGKALKEIGASLVGAIDVATVVVDPPIEAALHYSTVWQMKDEDFREKFPEQAGKIARAYALAQKVKLTGPEREEQVGLKKDVAEMRAWTTEQWIRHSTAFSEAVKAGFSEAWRKLSRSHDRDPEKTIKPFVRLLTDNPKAQKIAEPFAEMLGVVPALAAERMAYGIAKSWPVFYNPTTREAIVTLAKDLFIGGQSNAYRTPELTLSMYDAIRTTARSKSALTGQRTEEIEKQILTMFQNDDFSDPGSRTAATKIVNTFRTSPDATKQDREFADVLEAKIKAAEAEAAATAGKTVPMHRGAFEFHRITDQYDPITPQDPKPLRRLKGRDTSVGPAPSTAAARVKRTEEPDLETEIPAAARVADPAVSGDDRTNEFNKLIGDYLAQKDFRDAVENTVAGMQYPVPTQKQAGRMAHQNKLMKETVAKIEALGFSKKDIRAAIKAKKDAEVAAKQAEKAAKEAAEAQVVLDKLRERTAAGQEVWLQPHSTTPEHRAILEEAGYEVVGQTNRGSDAWLPRAAAPVVDEVVTDDFLAKIVTDMGAVADPNLSNLGKVEKIVGPDGAITQRILYREDITRDEMFKIYDHPHNALSRLGFDISLLKGLVATDNEAKLFIILHEKAHLDAGDALKQWPTPAPDASPVRQAVVMGDTPARKSDQEQLAMMYALRQFATLTGKSFHEVANPHLTPGSFVQVDPQTGRFMLRAVPAPDPATITNRASEPIARMFGAIQDLGDTMSAVKALPMMIRENTPSQYWPEPVVLQRVQAVNGVGFFNGVDPKVYREELSEIFRIKRSDLMSEQDHSDAVYQAFVRRFGATKGEMAKGTKRFPDSDEVYVGWRTADSDLDSSLMGNAGRAPRPEQTAKVVELIEGWRNIKALLRITVGTDMEQNAANLALAWRSQVVDFGESYTRVVAGLESQNRNVPYLRRMWVPEAPPAAAGASPSPMQPGPIYPTGWDGQISSMSDKRLDQLQGRVDPDDRSLWHEYSSGPGVPASPGMAQGSREMAHSPAHDALAKPVQGKFIDDTGELDEFQIARDRERTLGEQQQPFFSGPVTPATHSFDGTPIMLRALELEEFTGASMVLEPGIAVRGGKVNVFFVGDDELNGVLASQLKGPNGPALFRQMQDGLNRQIEGMATKVAEGSTSMEHLLLFHRSMAIAKGMQELTEPAGRTSLTTASWLKEMDLRAGAIGQTVEEAVESGLMAANDVYGPRFLVQRNHQQVTDVRVANLFLAARDKDQFVKDYARTMTSPEMAAGRVERNKLIKQLTEIVGGPCS